MHTLTADRQVESFATLDPSRKRYAANSPGVGGQSYANLSSLGNNAARQFHTIGTNSPERSASQEALPHSMRNQGRDAVNASQSALQLRKGQKLMTAIRQQRDPMQVTGLSDYVTTSKVAYSNINRIPTIKMEENKYLKYRPAANNFKAEEE